MSRIGKQSIIIPSGVSVSVVNNILKITGPKGTLENKCPKDIKVEEKEIEAEAEKIKQGYNNDPKVLEALKRPDVLDTLAATIQNRKVVELMKEKVCGKSTHDCSTHSHE